MECLHGDKMELTSKRFTTSFVAFFIALPVALILTLMYQNSSLALFEGFSKGKAVAQNITTNGSQFGGTVHNMSDVNLGGGHKNITVLQGKNQNGTATASNITTPDIGSENVSLTSSTNDSTPHTGNPDHKDKLLDGPLASGFDNASLTSSTNDSTPHTGNPDHQDKLLGGLLASGFDEASCISRMQSHLYRKASLHKPSPYLISKLRHYERLHTRCGPSSRAYNRNMKKIVSSNNHGASATCKYLVWVPANGLGNQMISMVATFLYAVLTDRVLLVRFGTDKHGLFCEPFLDSTWILPNKSPFWKQDHIETYQSMLHKDRGNNSNSKQDLPSALFLNLQHTHDDPEKFFYCDHSQDLLRKVPMLILQSDQYFVPSLFMNPSFNLEITKMFPEKEMVFHLLGRYLFHPSNEAWGQISRFYQAYLAKADERIGLQIRVFSPKTTPWQAVMDLLLNCTIMNKLLPELEIDMQNSVLSTRKKQTVKAVLVTSLYPEYSEELRAMYVGKKTVTGEIIRVYQPSHELHQKSHDNMHNMKAWTEMYLLSLCDELMTTSLSTFGYVAQGLGGLKPWLLYKLVGNKTHFPACERDFSLEPCYHIPPKHYCSGKPIKDFVSSFHYLRRCKDFYYGVKLVNGSTST